MEWFNMKSVAVFVAVCFFFYSIFGCGSSNETTRHLDKYDTLPYQDVTTVDVPQGVAYRAAILSLQQRGYVVTLSDPQTGLINTEINSPDIIPEEQKATQAATTEDSSVGTILLGILSIILIFGIVLWLVASSDEESEDDSSSTASNVHAGEPKKTTSYRYILTLTTTALTDSSTEIQMSAVKMTLENGSVIHSAKFENKYLNYSVFDGLYDQLSMLEN